MRFIRRRLRHRTTALVLSAVLGLGALGAGCSSGPDHGEVVDALITSGLSEEQARCAADALFDELTEDELAQLADRGAGGAPVDDPDRADDAADRIRTALNACRDG